MKLLKSPELQVFTDVLLDLGLERRSEGHDYVEFSRDFGFKDPRPHRSHSKAELKRVSELIVRMSDHMNVVATEISVVIPHYEYEYPSYSYLFPKQWPESLHRLRLLINLLEETERTGKLPVFPHDTGWAASESVWRGWSVKGR